MASACFAVPTTYRSILKRHVYARLALFVVGIVIGLALFATPRATAAAELNGVRVGGHGDFTRIVIDADQALGYTTRSLAGPPRLVVDLPIVAGSVPQDARSGLVGGLRHGRFNAQTMRLVFDMTGNFRVWRIFELAPEAGRGHRIVIDVKPDDAPIEQQVAALPLTAPETATAPVARAPATPQPPVRLRPAAPDAPRPRLKPETPVVADAAPSGAPQRLSVTSTAAAAAAPAAPRAQPAQRPVRPLIAIDAGHGGHDPGALGTRVEEKEITLAVARKLAAALRDTGRFRVLLTRDDDTKIPLRERYQMAERAGADLFISLHADANPAKGLRGASIYTFSSRASDAEAARLAKRENKVDEGEIDYDDTIEGILNDMEFADTLFRSGEFSRLAHIELSAVSPMIPKPRRSARFMVLRSRSIPSVLIELGFLTNRSDEAALLDAQHQTRLAQAIASAVERFRVGDLFFTESQL